MNPTPDAPTVVDSACRYWRDRAPRRGPILATIDLIRVCWEFARDSTPWRLRQRYGDADYDWDFRVNTTSAAVGWHDRLLGVFHSPYQPTDPALFRLPARLDYAALPRVIYTAPELAQVGLTETEARAGGDEVRVLRWRLAENDRAQAERRTEGTVKLVATQRGRLLGAGILAPHAGEMTGAWTLAIASRSETTFSDQSR